MVPEIWVPTQMRFCGLTVPEAVTVEASVPWVTAVVSYRSAACDRVRKYASSPPATSSASAAQSHRGILASAAPVARRGPGAGMVAVDMTFLRYRCRLTTGGEFFARRLSAD